MIIPSENNEQEEKIKEEYYNNNVDNDARNNATKRVQQQRKDNDDQPRAIKMAQGLQKRNKREESEQQLNIDPEKKETTAVNT